MTPTSEPVWGQNCLILRVFSWIIRTLSVPSAQTAVETTPMQRIACPSGASRAGNRGGRRREFRRDMARKLSKNTAKARALVEQRPYAIGEAIPLLQKAKFAKFDETVDLTLRLGVDTRHADQMVRGTVNLPPRPRRQVEGRCRHRLGRQGSRGRGGRCGVRRRRGLRRDRRLDAAPGR